MSAFTDRMKQMSMLLTDDDMRLPFQFICVYILLGFVSVMMSVVNIITDYRALMIATLSFAALDVINVFFSVGSERMRKVSHWLFTIELAFLFIFFIVAGEPEGFSVIWIAMLPLCSMTLYRRRAGTLLSLAALAVLVFFFWIPCGRELLRYEYTDSFCLRFPLLYVSFFGVAYFLETVRARTNEELVKIGEKYKYLYVHDALTGLENRYGFNKRMDAILGESGRATALAIVDVDYFKRVNDTYGHLNGDVVLRTLASELTDAAGENGHVCRWGGEEFAILFTDASVAEATCLNIIRRRRSNPIGFADRECPITVSIGLIIVPEQICPSAAELVRSADENLYRAKAEGRNRLIASSLTESMLVKDNACLNEQEILASLDEAIKNGEFCAYFQPQYNHSTGRLIGAEALSRWTRPGAGIQQPANFIPVLENSGMITQLDVHIFEHVCKFLRQCMDSGIRPVPVGFNVSRIDIGSETYFDEIEAIRTRYGVPAEYLNAEITESTAVGGSMRVRHAVERLHQLGYRVAMDDFGSGYSSLTALKDIGFDTIKLDMKFLQGDVGGRGGVILSSVVRMARWLDTPVIAEGVETQKQADFMKSIGCVNVQGYLYARPMPQEDFLRILETNSEMLKTADASGGAAAHSAFWDPDSMDTMVFSRYSGPAAIISYENGHAEVLRVNSKYMAELGIDVPETAIIGKDAWQFFDDENRAVMLTAIRDCVETGKETGCDTLRLIFTEKCCEERIWIRTELNAIENRAGRALLYASVRNVTAQKRLDDLLRSSDFLLRNTIEQQNIFCWEYNILTREMIPCVRCRKELGLPALVKNYPQPVIERGIFPPEYADIFRDWHSRMEKGEKAFESLMYMTDRKLPYIVRFRTIFDESGRAVKAYGSATPAEAGE